MERMVGTREYSCRPKLSAGLIALVLALVTLCSIRVEFARADRGAIHLGVGDCSAAGSATAALTNACLSNTGVITLVASFTPPVTLARYCGLDSKIYIYTAGTTLSSWWHMESGASHGCRAGKISSSF